MLPTTCYLAHAPAPFVVPPDQTHSDAQVSLWLLRVSVSVVARADLLPVDDLLEKLREVGGEEIAAQIKALDLKSTFGSEEVLGPNVERQMEVFGKA